MTESRREDLTVGLPIFGSMSYAIARTLMENGVGVVTTVNGRSPATRSRAEESGVEILEDFEAVFEQSNMVMSIGTIQAAVQVLDSFETWSEKTTRRPAYIEANPLPPRLIAARGESLTELGFQVLDAGICGLPPEDGRRPILLASGPDTSIVDRLDGIAFDVMPAGDQFGQASIIRMLHILLSKGINANLLHLMLVANKEGVTDELMTLLDAIRPDLSDRIGRAIPWLPADHDRFRLELEEAEAWLVAGGWSPGLAVSGIEALTAIGRSDLAEETRDNRDAHRSADATVRVIARSVPPSDGEDAPFILTHMTDDPEEIRLASAAGVDRIGPDLETWMKDERQGGMGTRISSHDPEAIAAAVRSQGEATPFCRVDPIQEGSAAQIEQVIALGARRIMLPMFRTPEEVRTFVQLIAGRARPVILVETVAATIRLPEILEVEGVSGVHIGLNDLRLDSRLGSRVELLLSPWLEEICKTIRRTGLPLHIGGIASIRDEDLPIPAEPVIARLLELGASGSLVTRVFANRCRNLEDWKRELALLRTTVDELRHDPERRRCQTKRLKDLVREARRAGQAIP